MHTKCSHPLVNPVTGPLGHGLNRWLWPAHWVLPFPSEPCLRWWQSQTAPSALVWCQRVNSPPNDGKRGHPCSHNPPHRTEHPVCLPVDTAGRWPKHPTEIAVHLSASPVFNSRVSHEQPFFTHIKNSTYGLKGYRPSVVLHWVPHKPPHGPRRDLWHRLCHHSYVTSAIAQAKGVRANRTLEFKDSNQKTCHFCTHWTGLTLRAQRNAILHEPGTWRWAPKITIITLSSFIFVVQVHVGW